MFCFIANHQCVECDAGSYRECRECRNGVMWENLGRCKSSLAAFMDQLQVSDGMQSESGPELPQGCTSCQMV